MRTWEIARWRGNPETPTIILKCYLLAMPAWRTTLREHLHILTSDLRRSARVVTKAPGFAFAALLAIVLGVASTTVVFSLINAVLIRSLPYGNADRLVYMWTPVVGATGVRPELGPYYSDMAAWQRTSQSFAAITALERYAPLVIAEQVGGAKVLAISSRRLRHARS